jgi:hypothetical protein
MIGHGLDLRERHVGWGANPNVRMHVNGDVGVCTPTYDVIIPMR